MENKSLQALNDFLDPEDIIRQLEIKKGLVVADFGCASGYFSIPIASVIGAEGKLYALDVLPHMLETVSGKAKAAGITNIETKRVNLEKENGSKLEKNSLDLVLMKDVLFQNKDKGVMLREAYSVLKNGGRIIIIEWKKSNNFIGPENALKISKEDLKGLIEGCGFVVEKELEAGDFHCGFLAIK